MEASSSSEEDTNLEKKSKSTEISTKSPITPKLKSNSPYGNSIVGIVNIFYIFITIIIIIIKYNLIKLLICLEPPYHGTDDWKVYIDGKFAHKEIKDEGPYGGKNICGSPFGDVVENVEF